MLFKIKLTLLVCLLAISNSVFASNFIEIKGIVIDTKSKPVPYIFVSVDETDIKVITDIDGNFILRVPNSTKFPIKLTFSSVNYVTLSLDITKSNYKKVQKIKLVPKVTNEEIIRKSEKHYGTLKGKVVDTDGKGVIGAQVLVPGTTRGAKVKAKDGSFTVFNITPGKYKVIVRAVAMEQYETNVVISANKESQINVKMKEREKETEFGSESINYISTEAKADGFATMDIIHKSSGGRDEGANVEDFGSFSSAIKMDETMAYLREPDFGFPSPNQPDAAAGLLTAGELNDFTKWKLWEDIQETDLNEHINIWKIHPNERYVAQLTNPSGSAIVNAKVTLKDNQGNNIWQTWTDNTGKAELWSNILTDSTPNTGKPYYIEFEYQKQTKTMEAAPFYVKINTMEMNVNCNEVNAVDIDFIVDATGSMGDEIRYLQEELYDVIKKIETNNPHLDLRTGSIFYRDFGDEYIIRRSEFDKDINKTIDFIKEQKADGGGDYPEAMDIALYESVENREWRENTISKIIFLILDAPPHALDSCIKQVQRQVRIAAMKGIRIVPIVCSGIDKSTEYLMRAIALATNGTYVFLTDDSKIGDSHIKPTTDKYEVEKLNHILLRIITQFSASPNCNNDWANFDTTLTTFDKFISKPYKEFPEDNTERIEDLSNLIKIYPMPCDGILNIETLYSIPHIYISDMTGKALQNFELEGTKSFTANLNGYSNGVYFVNAFYQGRWYSIKFLLSR
ncbi:MAG: carboxypeptidase regulatory-like domain-containing protein [Bacteroidetes bacterium]|nr:carboxypeptidase regulatory-like domain-containing protein [Bacteroidota bacterium]